MDKKTVLLATLIKDKYISMFGEIKTEDVEMADQVSLDLASKFSWNMSRARANIEIFSRQLWSRLRSKKTEGPL